MKILGIHYGHDANAAIVDNGKVIFAVSEERLNRKKFHRGFPFLSIRSALDETGLKADEIDVVALVNLNAQEETLGSNLKTFYERINKDVPWHARFMNIPLSIVDNIFNTTIRRKIALRIVMNTIERCGFKKDRVRLVDHHLSHAAGAFFPSGFREALVFTCDGKGDHVSHRSYVVRNNLFEKISESKDFDSAGFFYTCITYYLGFKKLRHEGKITGLAAYGDFEKVRDVPSPLGFDNHGTFLRNLLISERETRHLLLVYLKMVGENPGLLLKWLTSYSAIMSEYSQYRFEEYFKKCFNGIPREHVAAFAQKHLEDNIVKLVQWLLNRYKIPTICLSGGTFGNVRLNQKISELEGVDRVYIQPAMGDGGLSVGAALWEFWRYERTWRHEFLSDVYLGLSFSEGEVLAALKKNGAPYQKVNHIETHIAKALCEGKIVGRYTGPMEWGPRALGNRTILATATDVEINKTLNDRLKRTEFMPFAPIIIEEHAPSYFKDYSHEDLAANFMTITYEVKEDKTSLIPAVVHVDGTARPQVVSKKTNSSLYRVLSEYYRMTGISVLINTSFNMHEEPIVCTPEDALRAYRQGAVDILAIEDYLV